MHVACEDIGEAQDNPPPAKLAWNFWFAAATASAALPGTPGAIATPPIAGKKIPPVNCSTNGGFCDTLAGASAPSSVVAKTPKPERRIVLGLTSYASAARGCHCNS